jgi:hypothetical protein
MLCNVDSVMTCVMSSKLALISTMLQCPLSTLPVTHQVALQLLRGGHHGAVAAAVGRGQAALCRAILRRRRVLRLLLVTNATAAGWRGWHPLRSL